MENYKVEKIMGEGSFGQVLLVSNLVDGRFYAMKKFKEDRFALLELEMMELLSTVCKKHSHLACFHEKFIYEEHYYIVFDYVPGYDLGHLPRSLVGQSRERFAFDLIRQVLIALMILDEVGMVHRDIKPDNIIYNTVSQVFTLIDYGLSCKRPCHGLAGSISYVSPKIYGIAKNGDFNKLSDRDYQQSDIYALGVTVFEIVNGYKPYKHDKNYVYFKERASWRFDEAATEATTFIIDIVELMLTGRYTAAEIFERVENYRKQYGPFYEDD